MKRLILTILIMLVVAGRVGAATYYVNGARPNDLGDGTSWATAKKYVQSALDSALGTNDEVWIAKGTYHPGDPNPTQSSSMVSHTNKGATLRIYGGFVGGETSVAQRDYLTNVTTISGDISNGVPSGFAYSLVRNDGSAENWVVTWDGFIFENNWTRNSTGGSAIIENAAHAFTVKNSIIRNIYGDFTSSECPLHSVNVSNVAIYNIDESYITSVYGPRIYLDRANNVTVEGVPVTAAVIHNFVIDGLDRQFIDTLSMLEYMPAAAEDGFCVSNGRIVRSRTDAATILLNLTTPKPNMRWELDNLVLSQNTLGADAFCGVCVVGGQIEDSVTLSRMSIVNNSYAIPSVGGLTDGAPIEVIVDRSLIRGNGNNGVAAIGGPATVRVDYSNVEGWAGGGFDNIDLNVSLSVNGGITETSVLGPANIQRYGAIVALP